MDQMWFFKHYIDEGIKRRSNFILNSKIVKKKDAANLQKSQFFSNFIVKFWVFSFFQFQV